MKSLTYILEGFYKNIGSGTWKHNLDLLSGSYIDKYLDTWGVSMKNKFTMNVSYDKGNVKIKYYGKREEHTYLIPMNTPAMIDALNIVLDADSATIDMYVNSHVPYGYLHDNVPDNNIFVELKFGHDEVQTHEVCLIMSYEFSRRKDKEFTLSPYKVIVRDHTKPVFSEKFDIQQLD